MGLFDLFKTKKGSEPVEDVNVMGASSNSSAKKGGETYRQWGHRMAGLNQGNSSTLEPHLHIVVQTIKAEQGNDKAVQESLRQKNETQIASLQNQKDLAENEKVASDAKIGRITQRIADLKQSLTDLQTQILRPDRIARANFIIGCLILIPLTVYLFIFYSSTAYSAFFKNFTFGGENGLGDHMFDSRALAEAWAASWTTGLFVLLITFVFMAMGYALHQFSSEKGGMKYLKIIGIVLVTFIFDSLLAFGITEKIYNLQALTKLEEQPDYTVAMASLDPSFWTVIFCGFVAYIIWGLMYGFVMTNYNLLDTNNIQRQAIQNAISQEQRNLQAEQQNNLALVNKITNLEGQIYATRLQAPSQVLYDYGQMKLELNNFLTGWITYMIGAALSQDEIDRVKTVLQGFCDTLPKN